ncbi:MAG TPA: gamma-glutamylcyclotransferase family protein [Opitutaceae bacterium]|jgi:gamma-glutamylaminecyclotransferase|nr:gamma-glutamylcyclotransferase family protein [Opitutaceae bacterium]
MSNETLVFVYGTLKRGGSNQHYLAGQKFIGVARTTPGFRLFDLGQYPGMVPVADDRNGVSGEVWAVEIDCLEHLDVLEGIAEGLYRREPVPLLPPFAERKVETYFYARSVEGRRDIGGEYVV